MRNGQFQIISMEPNEKLAGIRSSLLNLPVSWSDIWISVAISVRLFVIGIIYSKKMESRFADII
jgi:ABC-type polysaccharide/polyol phosphate export permease